MSLSAAALLRAIAGALIGIALGVTVAFAFLLWLAHDVGAPSGAELAFVGALYALPIGALIGGVIGGVSATRGYLTRLATISGGVIVAASIALFIVSGARSVDVDKVGPFAATDSAGCRNDVRAQMLVGESRIVRFDRACASSSRPTTNVSLLPGAVRDREKDGGAPTGVGNVLVLETSGSSALTSSPARVDIVPAGKGRISIYYDSRLRIVSQHSPVGGMNFDIVPDTLAMKVKI